MFGWLFGMQEFDLAHYLVGLLFGWSRVAIWSLAGISARTVSIAKVLVWSLNLKAAGSVIATDLKAAQLTVTAAG